jgi:HlyD family secretion protein
MSRVRLVKSQKTIGALILLIVAAPYLLNTYFFAKKNHETKSVSHRVETGSFKFEISGHGVLLPSTQRTLTSHSRAVVEKIYIEPGQFVNAEDVIMVLSSTEATTELNQAIAEKNRQVLNYRQLSITQKQERFNVQYEINDTESELEHAKFELEAYESLISGGTISRSTLVKQQLLVKNLERKLANKIELLQFLEISHNERDELHNQMLQQYKSELEIAENKVTALDVKASFSGVVSQISPTEGESVSVGDVLAKITNTESYIAQIKIPQNKVQFIMPNADASISVGEQLMNAQVSRIDLNVEGSFVLVDLILLDKSLLQLRPNQPITARIEANIPSDTLFVMHDGSVFEYESREMVVLKNGTLEQELTVQFGMTNNQYAQIISTNISDGDELFFN